MPLHRNTISKTNCVLHLFIYSILAFSKMIYVPTEEEITAHAQNEQEKEHRLFDPPLYKQRYFAAIEIINQHSAKSVLDMGCSEGQFLDYVKEQCHTVQKIFGVDIDGKLLEHNTFRLKPKTFEFIIKRLTPLKMSLYEGSIGAFDPKFVGLDVISCIEVIEHLYDDVLQLVPECLFGLLKPKVAVVSTPNSEYNVLFKDFSGMRHTDHKFEWTRKEFKNWCQNIVDTYEYDVQYSGVGDPTDERDVGYCSQIAVFTSRHLNDPKDIISKQTFETKDSVNIKPTDKTNCISNTPYKLISEVVYPFEDVNINKSEKIMYEIEYVVNHFFKTLSEEEEYCDDIITKEILIDTLLGYPGFTKFNIDKNDIIEIFNRKLPSGKLSLSEDKEHIVVLFDMTQNEKSDFFDELDGCKDDNIENEEEHCCNLVDCIEEEEWA